MSSVVDFEPHELQELHAMLRLMRFLDDDRDTAVSIVCSTSGAWYVTIVGEGRASRGRSVGVAHGAINDALDEAGAPE